MKTIILPGFSPHNKAWADEVARKLNLGKEGKAEVIDWRHWQNGGGLSVKYEIEKILQIAGSERTNIIAKSVGTYVAAKLAPRIKSQLDKIILCGIPSTSEKRKEIYVKAFSSFPGKNLVCFQNENDPFAAFDEVKKFMREINPEVKVMRKPGNNHDYPYSEDFEKFLLQL